MADSTYNTLAGVITALKANADLTGLVSTSIYTDIPQQTSFPYCLVEVDTSPWETDDVSGMRHIVRVHGYSNKTSPADVIRISEYAYDTLHRQEASITVTDFNVVLANFSGIKTLIKEDGKVWHSVIEFNLIVQ